MFKQQRLPGAAPARRAAQSVVTEHAEAPDAAPDPSRRPIASITLKAPPDAAPDPSHRPDASITHPSMTSSIDDDQREMHP